MKSGKNYKSLKIVLWVALIATTLIYPLFMDILTALGWTVNSHSYGHRFNTYAALLAVGGLLVAAGTVLCLFQKDIAAVICALAGGVATTVSGALGISVAAASGWASPTEANFGKMAATLWSKRIYPTWVPVLLICALAAIHFFSYDEKVARTARRKAKIDHENRPAPKIVED